MKSKRQILIFIVFLFLAAELSCIAKQQPDDRFIHVTADLKKQDLKLYWKDDDGQQFYNIQNLKNRLGGKGQTLVFAMNAGMFEPDYSPKGLFIEAGKTIALLDTTTGDGNFYLEPNGVFYTTATNDAGICKTENFVDTGTVRYATQSGPMLVVDGEINPAFRQGSTNLNIRNGVGILPDNKVLFAMSKKELSFYDFATYFKEAGCENALYLDGFVSQTYLPEKNWVQTDGKFGVIIGITTANH